LLKDIEAATGLSNSAVSRTIHALGDTHRKGKQGFGLIRTEKDPEEGRRSLVMLSSKGERMAKLLQQL
jgi:DNA-binding MarR family transcriptional regulator